ncbi:MAG: hypothetical protein LBJ72_03695 [Dysgonamonadaceae bacterium]|jgi:hypothetical protein|nr:hypothetical protein [Dysgonamonadaceae bacterium]
MKTKITIGLLFFMSLFHLSAQNSSKPYEDGFLKRFGIGIKAGTYGPGIDLHTSLFSRLKARIGFNYVSYDYKDPIDFTAHTPDKEYSVDGYFSDSKLKFPNFNVLLDFYPVKAGIFCFTAGAYIGDNKISAKGVADEAFIWGNHEIIPIQSEFDTSLKMGDTFKPYFGIGLGRTISKSRVSFRFDMGVIYHKNYTIYYDGEYGMESIDGLKVLEEDFDLPFSSDFLKLWPTLSLSISYRIK